MPLFQSKAAAVLLSRLLIISGVVNPLLLRYNATTPAIYGVAMEVPDNTENPPNESGKVEKILPPGAEKWGYGPSSLVGPQVLNEDTNPPVNVSCMIFTFGAGGKKTVRFGLDRRTSPSEANIVPTNTST